MSNPKPILSNIKKKTAATATIAKKVKVPAVTDDFSVASILRMSSRFAAYSFTMSIIIFLFKVTKKGT